MEVEAVYLEFLAMVSMEFQMSVIIQKRRCLL